MDPAELRRKRGAKVFMFETRSTVGKARRRREAVLNGPLACGSAKPVLSQRFIAAGLFTLSQVRSAGGVQRATPLTHDPLQPSLSCVARKRPGPDRRTHDRALCLAGRCGVFDHAESRASSMRVIVPSENTLQAACSALQERRELVEVL